MTATDTDAATGTSTDGLLPQATGREAWRYVSALLRRRWPMVALTAGVLAAGTIGTLLTPRAMGWAVDAAVRRDSSGLTWPFEVLVAVAVVSGLLRMLGNALVAYVGEPVLATLREDVVEHALQLPAGEVERTGSGDLVARISGDVEIMATAIAQTVPLIGTAVLTIVVTLIGLFALDWRFAVAGLLAAPTDVYVLRWYFRRSKPVFMAQRVAEGARAQQLLDSVEGVETVRAFRLGAAHREQIRARSQTAADSAYTAMRFRTRFYGRLHFSEIIGVGLIILTGFFLVRNGTVTVGAATAAALYFARAFDPISMLMIMSDNAQEAGAALARLVGVARLPLPAEPAEPLIPADASVEVAGARYAYQAGHEVLHGVDLGAGPGEWVAVVGATGAGKTTLAKLAAGVHPPAGGTVTVGGHPVGQYSPRALRQAVALLTQEVHVFAGPLAEDLRLAWPDADTGEIEAALDRAGALGWVNSLPAGIDTVVGQGGHQLSPAQAQELALARLLLAGAPVVVLDEATAEAGSAGAKQLEQAARQALDGRTVLLVAHRLSQAAAADRVVVLDHGLVAESGPHGELVAAGGRYAQMWAAWSSRRAAPDPTRS